MAEILGYEIMGDDDDDVDGDMDVVGYDEYGGVVGRARPRAIAKPKRLMRIPARPRWRNQMAPGVIAPDQGLVPLTLIGTAGTPAGTFTATIPTITFQGQLQKPYRPERLLTSVVRTGASAVGRLLCVLYVGTDLQQAEITGWDAELVGQPNAFGTRLTCKAAEPGVLIRAVITLSTPLAGADTIQGNLTFLGRIIH